jgi:single-strand DNA-binding protein
VQTTIVGNITDDPELRFTPSGAAVANFTVAENRRRFDRDRQEWVDIGTTFVRCAAWRQLAENVAESLPKGAQVIVRGDLYTETYQRRDGGTGINVVMTVEDIGPTLRFATAKPVRTARANGQGSQGQQGGAGSWGGASPQTPANDPWGAPPADPGGEPPF